MSLVQRLPEGPLDIVGDIHGEIAALEQLLAHLGYDGQGNHPEGRRLVFVGDFCDRGPDSPPKPGWAMTSQARYLVYLVAGQEEAIYLIPFRRLRLCLPRWGREYPTGAAPNEGYTTKGLLVPLHELERIAIAVW